MSFVSWLFGTRTEHKRAVRERKATDRELRKIHEDAARGGEDEQDRVEARRANRVHENVLRKFAASKRKEDQ